jgi:hypothetical protein
MKAVWLYDRYGLFLSQYGWAVFFGFFLLAQAAKQLAPQVCNWRAHI